MAKRCKKMWVSGLDVFRGDCWKGVFVVIIEIKKKEAKRY